MPEFIETTDRDEAYALAPWAIRLESVDGGFMAFRTESDWTRWHRTNAVSV